MSIRHAIGAVAALSLLAAGLLRAQLEGRLVQSPTGERRLALVTGREGQRLEDRDGRVEEIGIPEGAVLSAVRELRGGWVVAGHMPKEEESDILLISEVEGRRTVTAAPGPRTGRVRLGPVPLVASGDLTGLAWLEGDDWERNAIRAAEWTAEGWGAVRTVSPAGPEARLGLGGAVLDDGSWLLVWAAVDGEASDLFWSLGGSGGWSAPRRLHAANDVPDLLPRVVAVPGGALAAWSRPEEGHYRLRLARFDGARWHDTGFRGEPGSLRPDFVREGSGAVLLYRSVVPEAWQVAELDARGGVVRRATAPGTDRRRPLLVSTRGPEVALRWLGERAKPGPSLAVRWEGEP